MKKQALTLVLLTFLGINQLTAQTNPFTPYPNTGDYSWSTEYESLYLGGQSQIWFRLLRPKNYVQSENKKYPMMVFFHGAGENDTDNYRQLVHGGQLHRNAVRNEPIQFDGFLLYPQIPKTQSWNPGTVARAKLIIDELIKHFDVDPTRIFSTGLSSGSAGIWDFIEDFPLIGAGAVINCNYLADQTASSLNTIKYTPIWISQGGNDKTSTALPKVTNQLVNLLRNDYGANVRYVYYPAAGHSVWLPTWQKPEYLPFLRNASKLNIMVLYGNQTYTDNDLVYGNGQIYQSYCAEDVINARLGITPGYAAYEWMIDGVPQGSSQNNEIIVTEPGEYRVRFRWGTMGYPEYDNTWTDWSQPVIVDFNRVKSEVVEISANDRSVNLPALDGSTSVDLFAPENYFSYQWQRDQTLVGVFSQNFISAIEEGVYQASVRTPAGPASFIDYNSDYTGDQVPEPNIVPSEYRPLPVGCYSDYSNGISVTTDNGPNAPTTPSNFFVYTKSANSIEIVWDDKSNNELNFELYRSFGNPNDWELVKMLPPANQSLNPQKYIDEELNTNAEYFYTMRAVNQFGGSSYTPVRSATTFIDDQAPIVPTLYAGATSREGIDLFWLGGSDNVGITRYDVYINGDFYTSTTETSYRVLGLQGETIYSFTITAQDAAGNVSNQSNLVSAATVLDGLYYRYYTHSGLSSVDQIETNGTLVEEGKINNFILGNKVGRDNFALIFTGYIKIPTSGDYRFYTTSDDGSKLFINGQQVVNNDGAHGARERSGLINLTAGVHAIMVKFFENGGGERLEVRWQGPGIVKQLIPDSALSDNFVFPAAPAAPTNLIAEAESYNQVALTWQDNSNDEIGFEIYRFSSVNQQFVLIHTTDENINTFIDTGLETATTYIYNVKAVNINGTSVSNPGIAYRYFEGTYANLNDPLFGGAAPKKSGMINNISLAPRDRNENFGFEFTGSILIAQPGTYTFYTESDDGSNLFINGVKVVSNDFNQPMTERSGTINLIPGVHNIKVTYRQGTGGFGLNVRYAGPSVVKQIIPDAVLNPENVSITTLSGPTPPSTPQNLTASALSTSAILLSWQHSDDFESGFEIERTSASNGTGWTLIQTIPTTGSPNESYTDTELSGNSTLYYRVRALGEAQNSSYSNVAFATTSNHVPEFIDLIGRSVKYEEVLDLLIQAYDADGDPLILTATGLPAFITFTDNGNNTGNLVIAPGPEGTVTGGAYEIFLHADDGTDQLTNSIIITISNNDNPVIAPISDVAIKEGYSTTFSISATDLQPGEIPYFTVDNLPAFVQFVDNGNGTGQFTIETDIGDFGSYNIKVFALDGVGGVALETFKVVVSKAVLDQRVYVNFSLPSSIFFYQTSPWLNRLFASDLSGPGSVNNLLDSLGSNSNIGLNWNYGNDTGTGLDPLSGVYPIPVMKARWVKTDGTSIIFNIENLNPKLKYNLEVFGWDDRAAVTRYRVGGQSVTLNNLNNTTEVGFLKSISPVNGQIELILEKATTTNRIGISSLIIESYYDDGLPPTAPIITGIVPLSSSEIRVTWNDRSITETKFEILRSTSLNGSYVYVGETPKNGTTFADTGLTGSTEYFYKVSAVNDNGASLSAAVSSTTLNSAPALQNVGDLVAFANTETIFNLFATDQENNAITFNILNLPDFVAFTDNGDGSATLVVEPRSRDLGTYSDIEIIVKDNFQNSSFENINLTVVSEEYEEVVFLNFSSVASAQNPWNSITNNTNTFTYTNLKNASGADSDIHFRINSGWSDRSASGYSTELNIGEFTDDIISSYWRANTTGIFTLTNLRSDLVYNISLFSSTTSVFDTITYLVNGIEKKIGIGQNRGELIYFNGLEPDMNGNISISVENYEYVVPYNAQSTGAYINAIVIGSYQPAKLISPIKLTAQGISKNSIRLDWKDMSAAETGFQIFRSQLPSGAPVLLHTTGPNVETFTDPGLAQNTSYQYQVKAVNLSTSSNYSNTSVGTTVGVAIYVNFNAGGVGSEGGPTPPWNNTNTNPAPEITFSNLRNDLNVVTTIDLTVDYMNGGANNTGTETGDNSGVFPDIVMKTYYFTEGGDQASMRIQELNENYKYNLIFFGSENGTAGGPSANNEIRCVQYIIGNEVVTLNNAHNSSNTVAINNVSPDQNNEINFIIRPVGGARWGFINCMVVQAYDATNEQNNTFDFEYFAVNMNDISLPQSWNSDINGNGFSPLNFNGDGLTYIIPKNASATLNNNLTISGVGSLLEIGGNNQIAMNISASNLNLNFLNLNKDEFFVLNGANKSTLNIGDGGISLNENSILNIGANDLVLNGKAGINNKGEVGQIAIQNGSITLNVLEESINNLSFVEGADSLHNLSLNSSINSKVHINSPAKVRNIVDIQSGELYTNDNLILISKDDFTGKIAKVGSGARLVGAITSQRQIKRDRGGSYYIGTPIKSQTIANWLDDFTIIGVESNPAQWSNVFQFEEIMYQYSQVTSQTNTVLPGRGFFAYLYNSDFVDDGQILVENSGFPVIGNGLDDLGSDGELFDFQVTYDNSDVDADKRGWSLIANPYPCEIDWNLINWNAPQLGEVENMSSAIYLWDGYERRYVEWNHLLGTSMKIASGQGFFVKAIGPEPVLKISEDIKVTSGATFLRKEGPSNILNISLYDHNNNFDQAYVIFHEQATQGYDPVLDVLNRESTFLNISSISTDGKDLAINSLPEINDQIDIPLSIRSLSQGKHKISFDGLQTFRNIPNIFLIDYHTGFTALIYDGFEYTFEISNDPSTSKIGRITLQSHPPMYMVLDSIVSKSSKNLELPVFARNFVGVNHIESDISWDFTKLKYQSILENRSGQLQLSDIDISEVQSGVLKIRWTGSEGVSLESDSLHLFSIVFNAMERALEPLEIHWDNVENSKILNSRGELLNTVYQDGIITISKPRELRIVAHDRFMSPIIGYDVHAWNNSDKTITNSIDNGSASVELEFGHEYKLALQKERTELTRGSFTLKDYFDLKQHLIGRKRLSPVELLIADIDHSGEFTKADLMLFRNYLLGKKQVDRLLGEWVFINNEMFLRTESVLDTMVIDVDQSLFSSIDFLGYQTGNFSRNNSHNRMGGSEIEILREVEILDQENTLLSFVAKENIDLVGYQFTLNVPTGFNPERMIMNDDLEYSLDELANNRITVFWTSNDGIARNIHETPLLQIKISNIELDLENYGVSADLIDSYAFDTKLDNYMMVNGEKLYKGKSMEVYQNIPNPFDFETIVHVVSMSSSPAQFLIHNSLGQLVYTRNLVINEGSNFIRWNGEDMNGSELQPGLFIYSLQMNGEIFSKKMLKSRW